MMLTDFHIHSNFSDGRMTIPQIVDLYGRLGFSAITITDHLCEQETVIGAVSNFLGKSLSAKTFDFYLETIFLEAERAKKLYNMLVIPGVEITKNAVRPEDSAHLLLLGINKYISADQGLEQISVAAREQGAIVVAAHPVHTRKKEFQTLQLWEQRQEVNKFFDAWEVASGPFVFSEVVSSGLPMIANSDLHVSSQINSWKSTFDCEKTEQSIFDCIRKQKIDFYYFNHLQTGGQKWACQQPIFFAS